MRRNLYPEFDHRTYSFNPECLCYYLLILQCFKKQIQKTNYHSLGQIIKIIVIMKNEYLILLSNNMTK